MHYRLPASRFPGNGGSLPPGSCVFANFPALPASRTQEQSRKKKDDDDAEPHKRGRRYRDDMMMSRNNNAASGLQQSHLIPFMHMRLQIAQNFMPSRSK
jgi:hypothetical protein